MSKTTLLFVGLIVLVVGGIAFAKINSETTPNPYTGLAQCIADSGATFFGAFWCPHCQDQKALFGNASDLLPYVECSTPDRRGQTQTCIDEGIESYPTWRFADGSEMGGRLPREVLAEQTGCELPQV